MENKLAIIVKESGLDSAKAKTLLDNFSNYFEIAAEWEAKAKMIKVTDASQKAEMQMARVGRRFLQDKRCDVERTRKQLKEQSLREGKAIDGIANVLKALIVPIEEYLDQQEHFVEIKEAAEAEAKRIEEEQRAEKARIAEEKRIAEEQEHIRQENIRLQKEAVKRERKMEEERKKAIEKLRLEQEKAVKERIKIEEEARLRQADIEEKARKEREAAEREIKEQQRKAEEERIKAVKRERAIQEQAKLEKERLEKELKSMITCPKCGHKFNLNKD